MSPRTAASRTGLLSPTLSCKGGEGEPLARCSGPPDACKAQRARAHPDPVGFGGARAEGRAPLRQTFLFFFFCPQLCLRRMNSVALITGASRGIGRGIALELAKIGCDLVINYASNVSAARQTATDCIAAARTAGKTIRAEICRADIGSAAERRKLIEFTKGKFARLDLLVNNAGVAPEVRADILEATEESFDRLIKINAKGPYFLTQLAARWMIDQTRTDALPAPFKPKI